MRVCYEQSEWKGRGSGTPIFDPTPVGVGGSPGLGRQTRIKIKSKLIRSAATTRHNQTAITRAANIDYILLSIDCGALVIIYVVQNSC